MPRTVRTHTLLYGVQVNGTKGGALSHTLLGFNLEWEYLVTAAVDRVPTLTLSTSCSESPSPEHGTGNPAPLNL